VAATAAVATTIITATAEVAAAAVAAKRSVSGSVYLIALCVFNDEKRSKMTTT
jgi:hypothetical protein